MAREYETITARNVGRVFFQAFGRKWRVADFMGRITVRDIGKRVFLVNGALRVETDDELRARRDARKIELIDERTYIPGTPRLVGTHERVPYGWTTREIMKRYGIPEHLTVILTDDDGRRVIWQGEKE